ncbi:hypothetical protein GR200_30830 [Rhizobium leguminosarum]|uniref:hypothetical protein n=1 Tax=Rhizobium leguminosarum TaxID=384 RepID=UPI0013B6FF58|nr:hypothetical protein [Rhizobium leguminosarum]NEI59427.1 hypothetical protein [Rhizobium leguminosarum]NEI88267.1 hypothetical protein [Rhizobium leguminosarum]
MSAPRWELHIRPMFNLQDWDHMRPRIDFADVESVWSARDRIILKLSNTSDPMPPANEGGPWPQEWTSLFERWVKAGMEDFGGRPPQLSIGSGSDYRLRPIFGRWELTGKTSIPSADSRSWLQLTAVTATEYVVMLYLETPPAPVGPALDHPLLTKLTTSAAIQEVIVVDSNGETRLPRP